MEARRAGTPRAARARERRAQDAQHSRAATRPADASLPRSNQGAIMSEQFDVTVPSPGIDPALRPRFVNVPTGPVQERTVGQVVPTDERPVAFRIVRDLTVTPSLRITENGAGAVSVEY